MVGACILLNSINLHAESAKECMKYWSEPAVQVTVLQDVQCPDIWEDKFSDNNRLVIKKLGLNRQDNNWMSTGACKKVKYNSDIYFVYKAFLKNNKTNLIILYNNKDSFAYLRKLDLSKFKNGYTEQDIVDVNLTCTKVGKGTSMVSILNSYILKDTNIKDISKYSISDWY